VGSVHSRTREVRTGQILWRAGECRRQKRPSCLRVRYRLRCESPFNFRTTDDGYTILFDKQIANLTEKAIGEMCSVLSGLIIYIVYIYIAHEIEIECNPNQVYMKT
jgi:hypothetical protein